MAALDQALVELRSRAGLSQRELADILGVERPVISQREHGTRRTPVEDLVKLAAATGLTFAVTPGGCEVLDPPDPFPENPDRSDVQPAELRGEGLPLIGRAGAGPPVVSVEEAREYWSLERRWLGRIDCALEIQGDSMSPPFAEGDLVGVRLFREDEEPRVGDYVAVWYPDEGEVQVKIWGGVHDGDVVLISTNSGYLPQLEPHDKVVPRGRVFGLLRMTEFHHRFENSPGQYDDWVRRYGPFDSEP